MSKLPNGFVFGFNNRRGDPQFEAYWYCIFLNQEGESQWQLRMPENRFTEEEAFEFACLQAVKFVESQKAV